MSKEKEESNPFFLILGTPDAGKTSLLYRLYSGIFCTERYDSNRDFEELQVDKVRLRSLNILENNLPKREWVKFVNGCSTVIYIIDTSTTEGILNGKQLFLDLDSSNLFQNIPLAIFANKSDIILYNKQQLEKDFMELGIQSNPERIAIFNVSIKTSEGIISAMDWIMKKSNNFFYIPAFRE
ncbi:MAG: ADP-ribosylation factor-like protein [Candidatus Hodarchaeota archaeon]